MKNSETFDTGPEGLSSAVEFVQPLPPADIACYADHTPVSVAITNMGLKNADFKKSALKVSMAKFQR